MKPFGAQTLGTRAVQPGREEKGTAGLGRVVHTVTTGLIKLRQRDCEFETGLRHFVSSGFV